MNMNSITFISIDGEPNTEDKNIISNGLLAHHASSGHTKIKNQCSILIKDSKNTTLGGIILSFLYNGMKIDSLWVDASIRGQEFGKKLICEAEKEGIKRNCTFVYTDTFSWQAPDFYKKLGYEEYGKLDEFPEGNALTYFRKKLL